MLLPSAARDTDWPHNAHTFATVFADEGERGLGGERQKILNLHDLAPPEAAFRA